MKKRNEIIYKPERPADVRRHLADIERLRMVVKELSLTSLDCGLEKTIKWYSEQKN